MDDRRDRFGLIKGRQRGRTPREIMDLYLRQDELMKSGEWPSDLPKNQDEIAGQSEAWIEYRNKRNALRRRNRRN